MSHVNILFFGCALNRAWFPNARVSQGLSRYLNWAGPRERYIRSEKP